MTNYINLYSKFLASFFSIRQPVKVIFDCSNGSTSLIIKRLKDKNLKLSIINGKIDGDFKAHGPDPTRVGATTQIRQAVLREKADLGIIFDADGDRVIFIDEKGRAVDPIFIFYFLARRFKPPYLIDVSLGKEVIKWLNPKLKTVESRTGHFFIKEMMREKKIEFAAEHSGHYYFKDFFFADSGILASILVINEISNLKSTQNSLSKWINTLPKIHRFKERRIKLTKNNQNILTKLEKNFGKRRLKISKIDGLSATGPDFWLNLRMSQTEPVLRLNLAAKNKVSLKRELNNLMRLLRSS